MNIGKLSVKRNYLSNIWKLLKIINIIIVDFANENTIKSKTYKSKEKGKMIKYFTIIYKITNHDIK
jgi:hypothetical protein